MKEGHTVKVLPLVHDPDHSYMPFFRGKYPLKATTMFEIYVLRHLKKMLSLKFGQDIYKKKSKKKQLFYDEQAIVPDKEFQASR